MKTKIENTIEATEEMKSALSAIKKAVRADVKASHLTAWCLSRLVNDGDTIDEAVSAFKDYLRADEGVDAKKAAGIINAARSYVPFMAEHETLPAKVPQLSFLKAIHGNQSPSEAIGKFSELQSKAMDDATASLEAEGIKPTLKLLREKVVENAPKREARPPADAIDSVLAFIATATEAQLTTVALASKVRLEEITSNRHKVASSL